MIAQEIIDDIFHLYTDDTTELSDTEELALLNRIYKKICRQRPWEWLKKTATGVLSTSVPYISLPADFSFLVENNQDFDPGIDESGYPSKVIFIGSARTPYRIINFSDRGRYYHQNNVAYLDLANSRIVFMVQPTAADAYEYDYIHTPADLGANDTPLLPVAQDTIGYGMAVDGFITQLFDKARSYAPENQTKYQEGLDDLALHNANLITN